MFENTLLRKIKHLNKIKQVDLNESMIHDFFLMSKITIDNNFIQFVFNVSQLAYLNKHPQVNYNL